MASPTDGSKPTGHEFSKKKKKPKPNLKTDGSKPNPQMVPKLKSETEKQSSSPPPQTRATSVIASRIGDQNSTDQIGDSFLASHLDMLPSPTAPPLSLSLPAPSTLRYFIFTLHFSSL